VLRKSLTTNSDDHASVVHRLWSVRTWPMRLLSAQVLGFIVAVEVLAVAAVVFAITHSAFHWLDLAVCSGLLVCSIALIEVRRRVSVPQPGNAVVKELISIWCLPIALILPPVYGVLAPIPLLVYTHLRVHTGVAYRRVFTAAAIMLAFGAAGLSFRAITGAGLETIDAPTLNHLLPWVGAALVAAVVRWAVNVFLVTAAIASTASDVQWPKLIVSKDTAFSDLMEICFGVVTTFLLAINPLLILITVPPVLMLQRTVQYAQLVAAVRRDSKTGLLNAATWDQEASNAVRRASKIGVPLAMLLLDIDHFKKVNDTLGHLAGDRVLLAIANTLPGQLRRGDLVGRFGGEEFVVLLPDTDTEEAFSIAERVRLMIAELVVSLEGLDEVPTAKTSVTVSIGVSSYNIKVHNDHADLLATADRALYRAKDQDQPGDLVGELVVRVVARAVDHLQPAEAGR
jgi:diguanylate cyclase (GGDEF)-like protein